ncbi:hypothetical protein GY45DRAFT_1242225 [Cubamyces sp. BRFM 1775]|nr:hypothetical protein GY45DRAFT_1242225 [Cubamyces sp. BRFM 1775]
MASSPSSAGSFTPLTPFTGMYFPPPHIQRLSNPPPTPSSSAISPTVLSFKQELSVSRVLEYSYSIGYPILSEIVPQLDYKPHTQSDRRRYVEQVDLEAPILFWIHSPEGLGIPLKDAITSRFVKLQGRDDPMFEGRGPSVSIRLNWPGYPPWSRQIPTRDFRSPPQPVTRAKLARNVAKTIKRFIEDMENRDLEDPTQSKWRVGKNAIRLDDLVLVGLQHVSMGSWQAHLRVVRRRH